MFLVVALKKLPHYSFNYGSVFYSADIQSFFFFFSIARGSSPKIISSPKKKKDPRPLGCCPEAWQHHWWQCEVIASCAYSWRLSCAAAQRSLSFCSCGLTFSTTENFSSTLVFLFHFLPGTNVEYIILGQDTEKVNTWTVGACLWVCVCVWVTVGILYCVGDANQQEASGCFHVVADLLSSLAGWTW